MSVQTLRGDLIGYSLLFVALTIWPGATLINSVEPFVLGLSFMLFVIAMLILGGLGILTALYLSETRER